MSEPRVPGRAPLTFAQIWNMSFGFLGIQFGWGLQMANMSAIYEYLGASAHEIPMLWLAAPLTGLLVQPVIGSMSDRTWGRLGRRRPYFLVGAILSSIALCLMPNSSALWMAAGLLWILDASINVSMEPFRAFVADLLPEEQRTRGFAMQSLFIGLGAVVASALPWLMTNVLGVVSAPGAGAIPLNVKLSFYVGAAAFLLAVLWTIVTTKEHPPADMEAFRRAQAEGAGVVRAAREILDCIKAMPETMKALALVQVCTWFGLFCMWLYFPVAVARSVFGATDESQPLYREGVEWAGLCFGAYSLVCFLFSFALPGIAARLGRRATHGLCLVAGGLGLLSVAVVKSPGLLLLSMVGVGIAWASILSLPYAILAGSLPADRTGTYMGIFNFFIVIPEIVAALGFGWVMQHLLGNDRLAAVVAGGAFLLLAAVLTRRVREVACLLLALGLGGSAGAEDWPEWRGRGRGGVWSESGIMDRFPAEGLTAAWRTPLRAGYTGPAVGGGRVYVTDFARGSGARGTERALCLDEKTGRVLWTREWEADYGDMSYPSGPRATPTVDGDRVYVVGATGVLLSLDARTGEVVWRKDYAKDYGTRIPTWGIASAPLVDGERLIVIAGGQPDAKVLALDKATGRELWRALSSSSEPGYTQPLIVEGGGSRQLIVWHPTALASLDPATGRVRWEQPYAVHLGMTLATPVVSGDRLLVSSFFNGSMLVDLLGRRIWKGRSDSEIDTDGLHAVVNTPVIDGDHVYGICSYGQLRCLRLATGERVWETMGLLQEKARWASGFMVRSGDRYFINTDRGDLVMARLSPRGYEEIGRTALIKPTTDPGNRRQRGAVNWSHPAYANRHVIARNDEEIVSYSLARP